MYWSKKDKTFFLTIVIITVIITVLFTNELYFKYRVEGYIDHAYGNDIKETKVNSDLSLELLKNKLNNKEDDNL